MEDLQLALGLVVPLTVQMGVGMLIRRCGLVDEAMLRKLNTVIFRVFIPLSVFFDIYAARLGDTVQPRLFVLTLVCVLVMYITLYFTVPRFVPDKSDAATVIQGTYRSNFVLFGSTIEDALCGAQGTAVTAALTVMMVPLYNGLAVFLFESMRGGKVNVRQLIGRILRNPMVVAGLLGAALNVLRVPIPALVAQPLEKLGDLATPLALVVLGGLLSAQDIARHRGKLTAAVLGRLVVIPAILVPVYALFGYRGPELVAALAAFASPTAISSAPMAQTMDGNGTLAGEIVALTSVGSIVSLFFFVLVLGRLGWL